VGRSPGRAYALGRHTASAPGDNDPVSRAISAEKLLVGRPGLDPGTLGLKGTCELLLCVGLVAYVFSFQGIVLWCVGLVSWCCGNMRPKVRPVWTRDADPLACPPCLEGAICLRVDRVPSERHGREPLRVFLGRERFLSKGKQLANWKVHGSSPVRSTRVRPTRWKKHNDPVDQRRVLTSDR
jgi:type IV secretory pathway TrbD component